MNPLARMYWTAKGVGWDNVPHRLLQTFRVRSGLLRRRLNAKHYTDEGHNLLYHFASQFDKRFFVPAMQPHVDRQAEWFAPPRAAGLEASEQQGSTPKFIGWLVFLWPVFIEIHSKKRESSLKIEDWIIQTPMQQTSFNQKDPYYYDHLYCF